MNFTKIFFHVVFWQKISNIIKTTAQMALYIDPQQGIKYKHSITTLIIGLKRGCVNTFYLN